MQGVGAVLHRQKVRVPTWLMITAAWLPAVILAGTSLVVDGPALAPLVGGLAYGVSMSGLMLALAGGRIAVSEGELHVQIGPFGPRIPIESLAHCELGPSGIRAYGLGAQKLLDGTTIYKMLGDNARAARLTTSDGRKIVIVCPDADVLVAALNEAMRRRSAPKARVAIEDDARDGDDEAVDDERARTSARQR